MKKRYIVLFLIPLTFIFLVIIGNIGNSDKNVDDNELPDTEDSVAYLNCNDYNCLPNTNPKDTFGIYTSKLNGNDLTLILSDPKREMTHPHVSPDQQWITFTRYNNFGGDSYATEQDKPNYHQTEILVSRIDGTDMKTIIPQEKGVISANSFWINNGKDLVYLHYNDKEGSELRTIYLDDNFNVLNIEKFPIPDTLAPVDPHSVGNQLVFPAFNKEKNGERGTWIMDLDGSNLRQIGFPGPENEGDNDVKLSDDGTKVAIMRQFKELKSWHIFIIDLDTGEETDISAPYLSDYSEGDAIPEWSSDGKKIIFFNANFAKKKSDIYTMGIDGTNRQKVPISLDLFEKHVSFFPGDGSSSNSRIIFSAHDDI